jgi:hypothetical protein
LSFGVVACAAFLAKEPTLLDASRSQPFIELATLDSRTIVTACLVSRELTAGEASEGGALLGDISR